MATTPVTSQKMTMSLHKTIGGLIGFGETNHLESLLLCYRISDLFVLLSYFRHPHIFCIISKRNTTMHDVFAPLSVREDREYRTVGCRPSSIRSLDTLAFRSANLVGCTFRRPQPDGCQVPLSCQMYPSRTYSRWSRVRASLSSVLSLSMRSQSGVSGCVQHSLRGVWFLNLSASRLHLWHIWRGPKHLSKSMVTTSP